SHPDDPARFDYECGIWGNPLAGGTYYAKAEHWLNPWGAEEIPGYDITLTVNACPVPVILANHSHYTITYDILVVVGEVQNNGEIGLYRVEVIANLFDGGDQLVDIGTNEVELNVLPPGDKTCFNIYLSECEEWAYYEFETPTYDSTSNNQLQNMTVHDDYGTYNPDNGSYRILGFVRNDNSVRVEHVQPIATLYNASGTVIGCGYTSVSSTHLNPGQSSSFELTFSGYSRDYADVASYRIQVGGSLQ
ncbi:MAG: hypothetical protein HWN68_19750, partial [Desulfobacterales bacterium]|nr:hypothetical protein [Desulfobacterales bacterium]